MSSFSFDGFNLHDGATYTVLAAGSVPARPAPLRHVVGSYPGAARLATVARPPGANSLTLAILVRGDLAAGTLGASIDALFKLFTRVREPRWLVVTLGTSARRVLATVSSYDIAELLPALARVTVTFATDGLWESATWGASVQTGALSSLVPLGRESGLLAFGHRLSLTPSGNAPVSPRVLLCVQSGSQTPTKFGLRSLYSQPPELTALDLSLAAGNALSFDPYLDRVCSLSLTNVRGWWPLADTGGTLRDFSSGSRDLTRTSNYKAAVTADTPSGWWRFEETSGTAANDSYGANHGTYYNSPTLGATGLITEAGTYAVTLNGTNQYISAPDAAALDRGDTFTIEVWLRRGATLGTYQPLVDKGTNAYHIRFNTSNQIEIMKSNVAVIATSTTSITDTNVHHVVWTKATTANKIYIDGVDVTGSVSNQTCADNATALNIGTNTAGSLWFSGTLDEVAIYSTALSAARVSAHYTAGTAADSVLYLQDGPLYGGVVPGWPAVATDGTAVFTSSSADYNLGGHISIGAWVYATSIGALMGVLGKATTNAGYWLGVTAAGLLTGGVGSGAATRSATGTTALQAGRWYHVALVWDGTAYTLTLYLDGEIEAVTTGGALTAGGYAGNFTFGSANDLSTTTRYWNGRIAEPWVSNAALTQTQVRNVYQRGFVEYNPTLRTPSGWPWPQLHGESPVSTTAYEVRVTHATTAPDMRVALAWHPAYVTA